MAEPPITIRAAHDSGPFTQPIIRIVIHATCPSVGFPKASEPGSALGTARYFAQAVSGGSAHYVEAVDGEAHCVPDNIRAWHAPPANDNAIGIEICAEGGDPGPDRGDHQPDRRRQQAPERWLGERAGRRGPAHHRPQALIQPDVGDVLSGLPVGGISAGALVGLIVLLILRGNLVPRQQLIDARQQVMDAQADRDYWRAAYDTQQQIALKQGMTLERLLVLAETDSHALTQIQTGLTHGTDDR
jgi:hypothetical protein